MTPGTIRKHALAILSEDWIHVEQAKKVLRFTRGGPRSIAEDFFGSFDAICFGPRDPEGAAIVGLIQWTSILGVSARLKKVEERFLRPFEEIGSWSLTKMDIAVWGYVEKVGFRVWLWNLHTSCWAEQTYLLRSPLLAKIPLHDNILQKGQR